MNIRSCLSFLPTLGLGGPQEWADRSDNLAVPKARCNWGGGGWEGGGHCYPSPAN